jgi:hypothetical protein
MKLDTKFYLEKKRINFDLPFLMEKYNKKSRSEMVDFLIEREVTPVKFKKIKL